jgi:hypothetical protein
MPTALYVCSPDGAVLRFNRQAVELWGRSPQSRPQATFGVRFGSIGWTVGLWRCVTVRWEWRCAPASRNGITRWSSNGRTVRVSSFW